MRVCTGGRPLLVVGLVDSELTAAPTETANRLADLPAFQPRAAPASSSEEAELLLHADLEHGVAYVVLSASAGLLTRAPALLAAENDAATHAALTDRGSERALTVLFHICHIILFVHPGRCADVRLLRALRVVATLKQNVHASVTAALKPLASRLTSQSHRPGTPASLPPIPKLGFVFTADQPTLPAEAAQLQGALEAQVRKMLASSKQLARSCAGGASSLYSLPKDGCAHLQNPVAQASRPLTPGMPPAVGDAEAADMELFGRLVGLLASPRPSDAHATKPAGPIDALVEAADPPAHGLRSWLAALELEDAPHSNAHAASSTSSGASHYGLRKFVSRLADGCQVSPLSGALSAGSGSEKPRSSGGGGGLPSASAWSLMCRQLLDRVFTEAPDESASAAAAPTRTYADARLPSAPAIHKMLDGEAAFSLARGQNVLPVALEIYARALPPQYTRQVHESRVSAAEAHIKLHVVGPARQATLARLRRECMSVWQAGRQMCGAVSLTGRPCAFRVHMLPEEAAEPPEGLAAASGLLKIGDRLLEVNGVPVHGHARATMALKAAVGALVLRIARGGGGKSDERDAIAQTSELEVELHKPRVTSKLGIVLSSAHKTSGVPSITALGAPGASVTADVRSARPHSSNHAAIHSCHCGRTQQTRADPFTLAEALALFDAPCCEEMPHLPVPLLRGSPRAAAPAKSAPPGYASSYNKAGRPRTPTSVATATAASAASAELTTLEAEGHSDLEGQRGLAAPGDTLLARSSPSPVIGLPSDAEASAAASKPIVTMARLTLLGRANSYRPGRKLEGVLPRMNMLTPVSLRVGNLAKGSPHTARRGGEQTHANGDASKGAKPSALEVHIGCEFECPLGHRFLGGLAPQPRNGVGGGASVLEDVIGEGMPLCRSCCAEGCAEQAQLQRLYVRTPVADVSLALHPQIRMRGPCEPSDATATGDKAEAIFAARATVVLPRDAFVCMRLPFAYGWSHTHALVTQAMAFDASLACDAVLLPNWLYADSAAETPTDANEWSSLVEADWIVPEAEAEPLPVELE